MTTTPSNLAPTYPPQNPYTVTTPMSNNTPSLTGEPLKGVLYKGKVPITVHKHFGAISGSLRLNNKQ